MRFVADLHVHSRYSRATSREADLAGYYRYARIKGIDVVGTGDFTHPRWFEELSAGLVEDNGLYRLKEPPRDGDGAGPAGADRPVRFMPTTEISSIYKKHGHVRKVHTLVLLPTLEDARRLSVKLAAVGNIASDGRPILGLDPKDLLSMVLEVTPEGLLVPAHVWTPWFSVFGSRSGFDAIEECFEELTPHIFALETGLSSDPPMNWRWSALDRYRLVSNSDAHSPPNLGREANLFDTDPSWTGIREALRTGQGFLGTFEFYPEEGKYHFDGHRACGVCLDPAESNRLGGTCPVCGKQLTIGVLNRVLGLADRAGPQPPRPAEGFRYIIPLPELLGELSGTGPGSSAVASLHARVLSGFGSEYSFLLDAPVADIERSQGPLLAEAVRRMREGRVDPSPGYDGEFGRIRVFSDAELERLRGQDELFPVTARGQRKTERPLAPNAPAAAAAARGAGGDQEPGTLDVDQRSILDRAGRRSVVFAGPGSGKTRLLAAWVRKNAASPVLALTFTNRAAGELRDRLSRAGPDTSRTVTACTFHSLCWSLLRQRQPALTTLITPGDRAVLVRELAAARAHGSAADLCIGMERCWEGLEEPGPELASFMGAYDAELSRLGAADIGALVARLLDCLRTDDSFRESLQGRWLSIAVDELQDINRPQYELLRLLCAGAGRVLCIGDPDQSIYGFRGADRGLFFRFRDEEAAHSFSLSRNYRSTAAIVSAAEGLIAGERAPGIPPLTATREAGEKVRIVRAADPDEEGRFIASTIRDLVGGVDAVSVDAARARGAGTFGFADIAILFRTRAVRDALLPGLDAAGLPLATGTGLPWRRRSRSGPLLAALRLVAVPADPLAQRILEAGGAAVPGPGRLAELASLAATRGTRALLEELIGTLVPGQTRETSVSLGLDTLCSAAEEMDGDLGGFLARAALCARESETPWAAQRISLLTFHAAKGLEFPVVFIAGAEEGVVPREQDGEEELAEERRLFYVAATRARDRLFVTHCARRRRFGESRQARPSRFLDDIPERSRVDVAARVRTRDSQLPLF